MIINLPGISAKENVFQMLDREHLVGGGMISVKQESTALLATEIDALMRRWLTVDDRARLRDGASSSSQNSPPQHQKWQREVKATPEDAAIQEFKVTKTTQTFFSKEPKGAIENSHTPMSKGKGGRGKGGGEPSPTRMVQTSSPTLTIPHPVPFYNGNSMQPAMGFQQYLGAALNPWYPLVDMCTL